MLFISLHIFNITYHAQSGQTHYKQCGSNWYTGLVEWIGTFWYSKEG